MSKQIDVYKIEDNVPMPSTANTLPPIRQLEVNQSILFPLDKRSTVQSMASRLKRETGMVFKIQKQNETDARIWRIQ